MQTQSSTNTFSVLTLSDHEFKKLSQFIYNEIGIKLSPAKKSMLAGRLNKRLRQLGLTTIKDYLKFLFSPEGQQKELIHLFDVVTTNKTDFFREPAHFDYLVQVLLPGMGFGSARPGSRALRIWSAGCSTGEEPYTLAMVLSHYAEQHAPFQFSIFATDLSTKVLGVARRAVYPQERIIPVPMNFRQKYLMRSKNPGRKLYRVVPELRARVQFQRLNFMDRHWDIRHPFHMIFCRNVIIYFDRRTQEDLINRFSNYLVSGGYLFLGHSETLNGMQVPFMQENPTVYRKIQ